MSTVQNPVLPGFHPDPSIIYHDGWFYVANSTFEWFGGVQISCSRDLANWEPVCQALTKKSQLDMTGNPPSGGIWAPCLSWSDGLFWLIFTDVKTWNDGPFKDVHNYLVTAERIEGPWSEPIYLNSSGFDPSLFHDEDGKKWLVNMEWDYRKRGSEQFSGILLQELDPVQKKLVGPIYKIWKGTEIGLVEGPHLYKKDGWYYLMCAEGGTEYEHAVSVARSRAITGPYETHPHNPLCTSRGRPDLYLQKAGHGSLCEGPHGQWYLAFLVGRPLPGNKRCVLGRETAIAPVVWQNDWPYLANGTSFPDSSFTVAWTIDPPKKQHIHYDFSSQECKDLFYKDFMSLRIPADGSLYSFSERPGYLRLFGKESLVSRHSQALVARRQTSFSFEAETAIEFTFHSFQHMAGLIYRYDESNWYYLRTSWDEKRQQHTLGLLLMDNGKFSMPIVDEPLIPSHKVYLKLKVQKSDAQWFWSLDGSAWNQIGNTYDASILSDEYGGLGFTGAFVGMACQDLQGSSIYADFPYFVYREL
ncbi:glycoside hydrolase family 43 protein [Gracilinema caldarium]|uniref:glycoside hydrolase family 43 protein n=1 Tax=Gracilinema caldarium TaxID=215591 RepID=UPI0026E9405F|nr:glycoside hydrolase family 43 protein [Gracilinema caldarium]